jgi:signal transduction histidine kinase
MMQRRRIRASSVALGTASICIFVALAIADAYVREAASGAARFALWAALLLAAGAVVAAFLFERRQARRIEDRSQELEQLSGELYRANRAKAEFLGSVSHELRTPLAAIVGFIDLLRDGSYGELNARQRGPVERIESSANHLRDLVEQVLDLARMSAGRLELHVEPVRLRPFVIDVVSEMEPLATSRGLALSISVPTSLPRVVTDVSHLRRILVNLIGNAIKFTSEGSVGVRAFQVNNDESIAAASPAGKRPLLHAHGAWIALQVTDTGVGIAGSDLERIFEEFEQVNAGPRADSERRGTGLGLTISRRLARSLDGDITVESIPGRGSVFTLWLPGDPGPPD